jgi:hypothetical protein
MPGLRMQFRIGGDVRVIGFSEDEPLRKEIWRSMSDQTRSLLLWPTPGIAVAPDDDFAQAVSSDVAPPRTFEILILHPRQADRLSLDSHPHRRRVWRADAQWHGVDVNP